MNFINSKVFWFWSRIEKGLSLGIKLSIWRSANHSHFIDSNNELPNDFNFCGTQLILRTWLRKFKCKKRRKNLLVHFCKIKVCKMWNSVTSAKTHSYIRKCPFSALLNTNLLENTVHQYYCLHCWKTSNTFITIFITQNQTKHQMIQYQMFI